MAILDKLAKQIADAKEKGAPSPAALEVSVEDGPRFSALVAGFSVPEIAPGPVSVGKAPAGVLGFFRGIPVSVKKPDEAQTAAAPAKAPPAPAPSAKSAAKKE